MMHRRFPARRSRSWPAGPVRRARTARGPAAEVPPAGPDGAAAAGDDELSPLIGLRATLNAFCHFFAPDSADPPRHS